jgi:hypothetical protein
LIEHKEKCLLKNDCVRLLEIQLNKNVVLDFNSTVCRFCNKNFGRKDSLHRHDNNCKYKKQYRTSLLNDVERTIPKGNITINNYTTNNTVNNTVTNNLNIMNYDHDYAHVTIDDIIKCLKISKEKREDAIQSLGRFIRNSDINDKSLIVTNLRGKSVKAYEDGKYVTKDAKHAISHRGQEAAYRLDSAKDEAGEEHYPLWHKKDFGSLESSLSIVADDISDKDAKKAYEAVKMAIYDANKGFEIF